MKSDAFLSMLVRLTGNGAEAFSTRWEGTIKWHGESVYRPKHKRINWFVGVVVLSQPKNCKISDDQLKREVSFESMRSGGPGGQHVNKTSSAVRITHLSTGIKIRVDADRSQHRNKKLAMERISVPLFGSTARLIEQQEYP